MYFLFHLLWFPNSSIPTQHQIFCQGFLHRTSILKPKLALSPTLSDALPSLAPILSFSWPGRLIFLYERKTTIFSNLMSFCPFPLKLLLTFPPFSFLFSVKCISVPQFDFFPHQIDFFYTWLFILYCGLGFMNVN